MDQPMRARFFFRFLIVGFVVGGFPARAFAAPSSDEAPVRNFVLTSERVKAFGQFTAVDGASVRPGGAINIYGEPGDFGWHTDGATSNFNVTVGAELKRSDGRLVIGSQSPLVLKHQADDRPRQFFFSLSLNIKAPIGQYTISLTLRYPSSGKTVARTFSVRASYQPEPPVASERKPLGGTAQAPQAPPADSKGMPTLCKRYFSQIGSIVDVPCGP